LKIALIMMSALLLALPCAAAEPPAAADPGLATDAQKVGYTIGQQIGNQLKSAPFEFDRAALLASIIDALDGKPPRMTMDEQQKAMMAVQEKARAKEQTKMDERKKSQKYNFENGQKVYEEALQQKDVTKTASGLAYQVIKMGTGPKPAATDKVRVHYRGTYTDGVEFDSSYSRNEPTEFPLDGVIKGWTEGLQLMPVGSKFKFWIPGGLAYGPAQAESARPTGVLIFEVELLEILK
jgi:FKBP-type peptidyl-prolyl cis-trans isomerase FkpA